MEPDHPGITITHELMTSPSRTFLHNPAGSHRHEVTVHVFRRLKTTLNQPTIMPSENLNMNELTEARREAIAESIHTVDVEKLKALGEELFPVVTHPWREKFFHFLSENSGATFYHAVTHDSVNIIYCPAREKGIWFLPGSGMGPLQPKGLGILKEIVDGL